MEEERGRVPRERKEGDQLQTMRSSENPKRWEGKVRVKHDVNDCKEKKSVRK